MKSNWWVVPAVEKHYARVSQLHKKIAANLLNLLSNFYNFLSITKNSTSNKNSYSVRIFSTLTLREWNLKEQERSVVLTLKNKNF